MGPASGPVLVLNAGSSSLKYRLVAVDGTAPGATIERIGEPGSGVPDHARAIAMVLDDLPDAGAITAVGHRVVHGGERFRQPVRVDDEVEAAIEALIPLAPLHNPANLAGIRAARRALPALAQVAVFDTAFHATLPPPASHYAIDETLAAAYGIRRYGFHGISVRYVVAGAARLLGRPASELNLVVLHLGNGASATAVRGGRSVDTSMGMTPLEGLVMGTRTGDIDPAVVFHLVRSGAMDLDGVEDLYQHRSGLLGLCGDNDVRTVCERAAAGDARARHALDVYCLRIRRYVGAYHAVLGRLDAIVFTAGVGEHSAVVRALALDGLQPMGIDVDPARNGAGTGPRVISAGLSRITVCVVPTDEERAIAEEVTGVLTGTI